MLHNKRPRLAELLYSGVCIAVCLLGPSSSDAQTNADKTVEMSLKQAEHGMYNGVMEKSLGRLGDAAAVALTRILSDKPISDADISSILIVVKLSYNSPDTVEDGTDRQPRTTLYLLRSLSQTTKDPTIALSIANVATYVKNQYAVYEKNRPNDK